MSLSMQKFTLAHGGCVFDPYVKICNSKSTISPCIVLMNIANMS